MTKNKDWINDFFKIGNGQVRFMATRNEVIDFISKVESQAREQGRREMLDLIDFVLSKRKELVIAYDDSGVFWIAKAGRRGVAANIGVTETGYCDDWEQDSYGEGMILALKDLCDTIKSKHLTNKDE